MARLTDLQREFINQYFLCGLNGTEAVIQAGYRCKTRETAAAIAYENLRKPHIREAIDRRLDENAMKANEVLYRLTEIARGDQEDFWEIDRLGLPRLNLDKAKQRGKLHLAKTISITQGAYGPNMKLEMYDAQSALVQLGRYYRLFTDRIEVLDWQAEAVLAIRSGDVDYPALAEEFGRDLATELFRQAGIPVTTME